MCIATGNPVYIHTKKETTIITSNYMYTFAEAVVIGTGIKTELQISCYSTLSCSGSIIYCPYNALCNINCMKQVACLNMELYVKNDDYSLDNNLICDVANACDYMKIICNNNELTTDYVYAENMNQHKCANHDCCPFENNNDINILDCTQLFGLGNDCNIDCNNYGGCPVKTFINASDANSLIIECNEKYECQYIDILCPHNGDCNIICSDEFSCENMKFYKQQIAKLSLNCLYDRSCPSLSMDFNVTNDINISCSAMQACGGSEIILNVINTNLVTISCLIRDSCYGILLKIDGKFGDRSTGVILNAQNYVALKRALISIDNVNQFNMTCSSLLLSSVCSEGQFDAENVESVNFICIGSSACTGSDFDIVANRITFYCDGDSYVYIYSVIYLCNSCIYQTESCADITIFADITDSLTATGINPNVFENSMISYAECPDCINIYNCMQNITIFCGLNETPYIIGQNDQCRNCMCDHSNPVTRLNHTYYDDIDNVWSECNSLSTPSPITSHPTSIPTLSPTEIHIISTSGSTYEPTLPLIATTYVIDIGIIFALDVDINGTSNIYHILANITEDIINDEIMLQNLTNCVISSQFDIMVSINNYNEVNITAKIFTSCDYTSQIRLSTNIENKFRSDFIDIVNNKTSVNVDDNSFDIDINVNNIYLSATTSTTAPTPSSIPISTTNNDISVVINNNNNRNDKFVNNVVDILLIILSSLVCMLCIFGVCYYQKKEKYIKIRNERMIQTKNTIDKINNLELISMKNKINVINKKKEENNKLQSLQQNKMIYTMEGKAKFVHESISSSSDNELYYDETNNNNQINYDNNNIIQSTKGNIVDNYGNALPQQSTKN